MLEIEVYEDNGDDDDIKHVKLKPTSINNQGALLCFDETEPDNVPFYVGEQTSLTLVKCDGYTGAWPSKVQFYREVYLLGNAFSELIKTDTSNPFDVSVSVDGLPRGLQIVVKAK